MNRILKITLLSAGLLFGATAFAGKSDYLMIIDNSTLYPMTIQHTGDGCTTWDQTPPASVTLAAKTLTSYTFHRAGRCSGDDGQVYFSFTPQFAASGAMGSGTISTDYTADHQQTTQVSSQGTQFNTVTFQPYASGDQDKITVTLYDSQQIDIPTALSLGFMDPVAMNSTVSQLNLESTIGSVTQQKVQSYAGGLNVTSYNVTVPIWGFRTLKFEDYEASALMAGFVPSYALRALRKSNFTDFLPVNGPYISNTFSSVALGMRLLAVSSSSQPTSQFASVGLDYATAADPNWHSPGQFVYAFFVIPDAPIQGVSSDPTKSGEKQVQILGGTPITSLYRSVDNLVWQKWSPDSQTWVATSTIPTNNLQSSQATVAALSVRASADANPVAKVPKH
ncbi:hypothetical protein RugamoR64_39660 [Duganella rhizosphaerae]|uniref:hypothetical protein n=1 Tax=Duganella rhizosphaerae TaxID=2885763 RepID=UPI0030E92AB9